MEDRLRRVEQDLQRMADGHERLESKVNGMSVDHAVLVTTAKQSDRRLTNIEGSMNKLVWLLIAAIAGSLINFIIGGGIAGL